MNFGMKFREASSGNPKMVDASTKVDDSSTNSIENIDFEATTAAEGCALSFLETGVCSSGTNSLKLLLLATTTTTTATATATALTSEYF